METKKILITGAGSGFGEGAAIGLAKLGHKVIAGVQISPQVTALRKKAEVLGLQDNLRVERLDLLDPYDVKYALTWDIDILFSNAGIGEAGPTFEIPVDLVRRNFETNVFAPLSLAQQFIAKFIREERKGKIVFTSSMGGLFTPPGYGIYVSTKHALEAIAEALQNEVTQKYGIQIQTINPGAYLTGYNETMADNPFRWLDDSKNFTKRAEMREVFDSLLGTPQGRLDPTEMIDAMIQIVPADTGKFRNVVPKFVEDMLKEHQLKAWDNTI
ncbi:NAD(P)-dependent dehydrogenase, short-chain alcohol dehydrogenase family [Chitinophaga sp. CF118]|uniref:SDR family oxidoreductase n=1 Tax=Chitinophaga sp. CF118 TaxID=1884367 RepID=UPI0008E0DFE6|nr:SDR family oxidoreductase [Chitinophaga sp. CF118]SFD24154.1 NAD(P)-dependent dehydrogenase, short-chain alcohol dehydrogenase family [Chitinophaga sp. CF118]